jgi:hypothetical protein
MCDEKKGAFPSPSSDKFSLWELGILGSPHYFKWGLRSVFRLDRVKCIYIYIYIIGKDLNESYKLMGPIAKKKEFPQIKVRVV